ncbi:hypothetical protein TraAM80_09252 [Trypanosoma rangeli]|uniref:Uncharacterized protein n=1 Tax=Trypanosoma rangeli TaxID=5698 RepID=A0A3R7MZB6_TRYRA|nr:uncharacterized protein TraAM80_09252 [Trypanosoma rangeli]RNE97560.1 hypothetical protein TraAM80_09252 [Trypanosoma rangeli]|eukprot:RNE97560.1 hypothetical protein TraAM80_09252 [Trypanosoma rangeli]
MPREKVSQSSKCATRHSLNCCTVLLVMWCAFAVAVRSPTIVLRGTATKKTPTSEKSSTPGTYSTRYAASTFAAQNNLDSDATASVGSSYGFTCSTQGRSSQSLSCALFTKPQGINAHTPYFSRNAGSPSAGLAIRDLKPRNDRMVLTT